MSDWVEKDVFIVGKTYPTPHKNYLDTVCTGGITREGEWIRLYPIGFRYLEREQQYSTYTWLRLKVRKNQKDKRIESYEPDVSSITVLGQVKDWSERKRLLSRLLVPNLEGLYKRNRADWKSVSMGLVEIEYLDFHWKATDREWSAVQLKYMNQMTLFGPQRLPLQKMPYDLKLKFRCKGNPECTTHDMTLFVWEYNQTFRKWLAGRRYGGEDGVLHKIKEKMMRDVFDPKHDTYVLVGTLHKHPKNWIIGGVFFPPKGIPIPGVLF